MCLPRRILLWACVACLVPAAATHAADPTEVRPPNVVVFLVDDLGWRDVACYGSELYETPHIDQLARDGVRFTNAYAACHVCSPTRASIMTGNYPARLMLTDWLSGRRDFPFQRLLNAKIHQALPLEQVTLAEALKRHGYATGHFGKWHLGEDPMGPLQQGFDVRVPEWNKGWPKSGYHAPFGLEGIEDQPGQYLTDRLTDEAIQFVEANQSKPFFLYLSHFAVHDPIQGRSDLVEKYRAKIDGLPETDGPAFILEGNPDNGDQLTSDERSSLINDPEFAGYKVLPRQTVKIKQRQDNPEFAGMVESMDESLGRVVAKLGELGIDDETLIVFCSDNGGMSGANFGRPTRVVAERDLDRAFSTSNLPLRGAKGWLYEGGIRVPMIVKWPGTAVAGSVCDEPVISTDFYPTILEMAGLPSMPEQVRDGKSFVPALKGEPFQRGPIFWHFPHYSNHGMQSPGGAVRLGDYKLLDYFENGSVQLFNLAEDIGEQHDLSKQEPEKASELKDLLREWRMEVAAKMMPPNPNYQP